MKLIEAMKTVKEQLKKVDDLKGKIGRYCAAMDFETPTYGTQADQQNQVASWLQSHGDAVKEIERLRLCIARTNLATLVRIEVSPGLFVEKCITAWVLRRKELAKLQATGWEALTDRNLKEGFTNNTTGDRVQVKIVRYFSQAERDKRLEALLAEPGVIDKRLEVVNATTDLIEEVA